MQGSKRPIMARVHRLQHIQRLTAATFTHDDTVWAHTQGITNQISNGYYASSIGVGDLCFHTQDMILLKLQLSRIFDCDDPFFLSNITGKDIEKGGLA